VAGEWRGGVGGRVALRATGASLMPLLVATAAERAARDAAAIAALRAEGAEGFTLMRRAGERAAAQIAALAASRGDTRVLVRCGAGNNGGDGWVVADRLRRAGLTVAVESTGSPRSEDAQRAQGDAVALGAFPAAQGTETLVVDALLGTGASGAPRGAVVGALQALAAERSRGAVIVALDLPSGLDATTGEDFGAVRADVTLTFGTVPRGLLLRRDLAGAIRLLAIGIEDTVVADDRALPLLDAAALRAALPRIGFDAHKGTRGRVAIMGGAPGMAGAVILAARGALRAGAGLVHAVVAPPSIVPVQVAVPQAIAHVWDDTLPTADALVVGPGLGPDARRRVEHTLAAAAGVPVLLDADALNAMANDLPALRALLAGRAAVLTPHPAECARLLGVGTADVLAARFDVGATLAAATGAVVVLKGTPTVIHAPDGRVCVAPVGSPVLATGGSGDVLAGIAGALLAVMPDAFAAACTAVWAHGAAAESVGTTQVRGHTLDDVLDALATVWHAPRPTMAPEILWAAPAVGE
jgi:hydroxyethylthiazole kinase-like uncharacterized protein yjeF